jgi:hypothetical protein
VRQNYERLAGFEMGLNKNGTVCGLPAHIVREIMRLFNSAKPQLNSAKPQRLLKK